MEKAEEAPQEIAAQEALESRTESTDRLIVEAVARHLEPNLSVPFSIAAVGGYGRRELFPYSDVDLLVLVAGESAIPVLKEPVSEFLRVLWDAGLRASQSVRTVAECSRLHEQNIELHISLLDLRYLCGDTSLFSQLSQALPEFYRRQESKLIGELAEMTRQRHAKFNNTVYHLEPNVKEAPGGIRDIHFLHWLALLAQDKGPIHEALEEMAGARRFLYAVRCFLHRQTGRDNNLLGFELQDRAAAQWAGDLVDGQANPAEWMRLYYRNARRVFQSSLRALEFAELKDPSLLRQFRDWRGRLSTADFTVSHERVFLRNPALILSSPESVLGLFTFVARHGIALSGDAQRRLKNESGLQAVFRRQPVSWAAWFEFFSQPNVALALRQMQATDLLSPAIPHWQQIECLVVRDFYHRYTVDEHSIVAVEVIDQLAANPPGTPPRFHELLLEEEDPGVLRLALLLHDIGKGTRPGEHVRGSLEAAEDVFERLSVPEPRREAIRFLIGHHLDLSTVMNGRDLEDPATARFLTSRIPTQEDLRRLTLLTFADISAVNPTAMTPWRLEQLWRVYATGLEQLTRELIADRIQQTEPAAVAGASPELACFLEGFPTRYLRTHTREQIEQHFALDQKRQREGVAVTISQDAGAYLLTVLAADQAGTFAALCGALASRGMNILKAEASSNKSGCILDLIRFSDPMRNLELNPDEISRLEWTIECVLRGSVQVADLLKQRRSTPRPSSGAKIMPALRFTNDASDCCTLIDFVGEDRPGLLYDLTSALADAGCNIELVLVDTEAHKAIDVFYITKESAKLDESTQDALLDKLKRAAVPD
jgi:[protein-PII] uridylyltransferase